MRSVPGAVVYRWLAVRSTRQPAQRVIKEHRQADEKQGQRPEGAPPPSVERFVHMREPWYAIALCAGRALWRVASRKNALNIPKYNRSADIDDSLLDGIKMSEKTRVRRPHPPAIAAPSRGTHPVPAGSRPAARGSRPTTPRMKAITWLFVTADMQEPTAR